MRNREFSSLQLSVIGLGCSRLGSFAGATPKESERIIRRALERGVTFFDTASSYGQGDSERMLGRILRLEPRICVATKVGKVVPAKARLLRPVKTMLRGIIRRSPGTEKALRRTRGDTLPTCFESPYLQRQIDQSLKRLRFDSVPMMMLHSPSAEVLRMGDAVSVLQDAKRRGDVRVIGASVDDIGAAEAALDDDRIEAIQIPIHPGSSEFMDWATTARNRGRLIVAREVLKGIASAADAKSFVASSIATVAASGLADVTLVGTTKLGHLDDVLDVSSSMLSSSLTTTF